MKNQTKDFTKLRQEMVKNQLLSRDIYDKKVISAFQKVPRHEFVLPTQKNLAYQDNPLEIGFGQSISQPYIVAKMCQLLKLTGQEKVLDIGTGSGYEAAILSQLSKKVISIEIIPELAERAEHTLKKLNYDNVTIINQNGRLGYPPESPFDRIKSAAAADKIPPAWKNQLKNGGIIILPQKRNLTQELLRVKKVENKFIKEYFGLVAFVPLIT